MRIRVDGTRSRATTESVPDYLAGQELEAIRSCPDQHGKTPTTATGCQLVARLQIACEEQGFALPITERKESVVS